MSAAAESYEERRELADAWIADNAVAEYEACVEELEERQREDHRGTR